jgi:hypothetical protein
LQEVQFGKEAINQKTLDGVSVLRKTLHLILEDDIVLFENTIFSGHLLLDILLSLEDLLKILPQLLDDHECFKSLSDLSNVSLPVVNSLLELFIESRGLELTKLTTIFFNDLHNEIS